jgi:hypothetical protein
MQETKLNGIRRILNFISKYELGLALSGIFILSVFFSFSLCLYHTTGFQALGGWRKGERPLT